MDDKFSVSFLKVVTLDLGSYVVVEHTLPH